MSEEKVPIIEPQDPKLWKDKVFFFSHNNGGGEAETVASLYLYATVLHDEKPDKTAVSLELLRLLEDYMKEATA